MELSKQRFLFKFECYIKVYSDGNQAPAILFKEKRLKPLEGFFNDSLNRNRLNLNWYSNIRNHYQNMKMQSFENHIDSKYQSTLNQYLDNDSSFLSRNLANVSVVNDKLYLKDEHFILELVKYYNEESLFPIFGFLDCKFDEIRIILEDKLSIIIRKTKSFVSEEFCKEDPLILDTSELLFYFDAWFQLITDWKADRIPGLKFKEPIDPIRALLEDGG